MTNHYDTIIIGAGYNDLTPSPSPAGRGGRAAQKQNPRFSTRIFGSVSYAGMAIYSAEATPSGIGNLSSIMP